MTEEDPKTTEKTASISRLAASDPAPAKDGDAATSVRPSGRSNRRAARPKRWWSLSAGLLGAIVALLAVTVVVGTCEETKSKDRVEATGAAAPGADATAAADVPASGDADVDASEPEDASDEDADGSREPSVSLSPLPTPIEPSPERARDASDEVDAADTTDDGDHVEREVHGSERDAGHAERDAGPHADAGSAIRTGGAIHDAGHAEHDAGRTPRDGGSSHRTNADAGGHAPTSDRVFERAL